MDLGAFAVEAGNCAFGAIRSLGREHDSVRRFALPFGTQAQDRHRLSLDHARKRDLGEAIIAVARIGRRRADRKAEERRAEKERRGGERQESHSRGRLPAVPADKKGRVAVSGWHRHPPRIATGST